ncbi:MAG TPA: recombinase [Epulopiscium sp.]|nr:recombinase [Candidatus Epulonipiscium sp.]
MADKEKETLTEPLTIYEKLHAIQLEIRSPKDQKAKNYNYRSTEDIIAALKPFLKEHKLLLLLNDDLQLIGDRYYVKSTVTLKSLNGVNSVSASAFAREQENLSIMSQGQLSGATSSFARKYALGALLGIDDTEDLDKQIDRDEGKDEPKADRVLSEAQVKRFYAIARTGGYDAAAANKALKLKYNLSDPSQLSKKQYDEVCNAMDIKKKATKVPTGSEVDAAIDEDVPF